MRGVELPASLFQDDDYTQSLSSLVGPVEELTRTLEKVIVPRRRLGRRGGFTTGTRLDLRGAMAFEADPRRGPRCWERTRAPNRRSAAFLLLVDLSGSMRGEKVKRAVDTVVVFIETLTRLSVPFAVYGFQDELIPVADFGEPFGEPLRERVRSLPLEVSSSRPGGHNQARYNDDGPCLSEAAAELMKRPEEDLYLFVLSDGHPEGRRSSAEDLRTAVDSVSGAGVSLVGLGVGEGTEHVTEYYPTSRASIPLESLPSVVGELISSGLQA
jgi:nitric oxide reductase activation protein